MTTAVNFTGLTRNCCIMQIPLIIGNAFLVFRQILGVIANVTTNELIVRKKYPYLCDQSSKFHNSFDRGCASNCHQFWCEADPNWAQIYSEDRQVCVLGTLQNLSSSFTNYYMQVCDSSNCLIDHLGAKDNPSTLSTSFEVLKAISAAQFRTYSYHNLIIYGTCLSYKCGSNFFPLSQDDQIWNLEHALL